jgi:acyl-CoA thioester hydrolase
MTQRTDPADLLSQVLKLPRTYEMTVPADFLDMNGHMNIMYYTQVGNMALSKLFGALGLFIDGQRDVSKRSTFAVRQVLSYMNELREGEEIAVHSGMIGYDNKRLHFMHYIVSLSRNRVASSDERMAIYIDMMTRRTTDFEPELVERLEKFRSEYAGLGWQPELSGAIKLKNR